MKKILLLLTMLVGAMTVQAEDYTYLTFETTDGAKASVSVASDVTLTISGTTLTVGTQSFTLSNLSKMYFSTTDETGTTGIETIDNGQLTIDNSTEIYDLQGHKVSKDQMRRGVYIVKTNSRTYKMVVR